MIESLPDEIGLLVRDMNWAKNEVGMSCDEVYRLTSDERNFYLKVKRTGTEAITKTLKREGEVLNGLKGKLPVPEVVCYHKDPSKEYLLVTEVPGFMAMETGWDKKKVVRRWAEGLTDSFSSDRLVPLCISDRGAHPTGGGVGQWRGWWMRTILTNAEGESGRRSFTRSWSGTGRPMTTWCLRTEIIVCPT